MSSEQDKVLSLDDSDEKSFSGFSLENSDLELRNRTSRVKSAVSCKTKDKKKKKIGKEKDRNFDTENRRGRKQSSAFSKSAVPFDVTKLSKNDLDSLREALGITTPNYTNDEDIESVFGNSLENLPSLRVEVDRDDVSVFDEGHIPNAKSLNLADALFEEGEIPDSEWEMPKLKSPEKGKPISKSLANMINVACTSQCDVEQMMARHGIPENCEIVSPPLVNEEVWKILDRRIQSQDRGIADVQNLNAAGITSILKLAESMKSQITANEEAKKLMSDALTIFGQVQYNLSVRRRYLIRPQLKKKYQGLCSISKPITSKLFGDDVAKDIKACDSMNYVGQNYAQSSYRGRYSQRGQSRRFPDNRWSNQYGTGNTYGRSNYGAQGGYQRYQPYPQRGGYNQRPAQRGTGYRIPKKPTQLRPQTTRIKEGCRAKDLLVDASQWRVPSNVWNEDSRCACIRKTLQSKGLSVGYVNYHGFLEGRNKKTIYICLATMGGLEQYQRFKSLSND